MAAFVASMPKVPQSYLVGKKTMILSGSGYGAISINNTEVEFGTIALPCAGRIIAAFVSAKTMTVASSGSGAVGLARNVSGTWKSAGPDADDTTIATTAGATMGDAATTVSPTMDVSPVKNLTVWPAGTVFSGWVIGSAHASTITNPTLTIVFEPAQGI